MHATSGRFDPTKSSEIKVLPVVRFWGDPVTPLAEAKIIRYRGFFDRNPRLQSQL
jgi:hypothetical protein